MSGLGPRFDPSELADAPGGSGHSWLHGDVASEARRVHAPIDQHRGGLRGGDPSGSCEELQRVAGVGDVQAEPFCDRAGRLLDGDGTEIASAADRAADRASIAATTWTDPALLSMRAERATEIRAAVIALPEPYREVVALRFFADASLDQIATQTGRPLGTVKTHLHRGLARLRAGLEGLDR